MSKKKSFIARLFGKQEAAACCAVRIEEIPEEPLPAASAAKKSACCTVRIEEVREDGARPPPASR